MLAGHPQASRLVGPSAVDVPAGGRLRLGPGAVGRQGEGRCCRPVGADGPRADRRHGDKVHGWGRAEPVTTAQLAGHWERLNKRRGDRPCVKRTWLHLPVQKSLIRSDKFNPGSRFSETACGRLIQLDHARISS
jgi:hypothetical protein